MPAYNDTPWHLEVDFEETWIEGQTHTVCHGVSNEDAERIVKCVNSHNGLVEALDLIRQIANHPPQNKAILRIAEKALSGVES